MVIFDEECAVHMANARLEERINSVFPVGCNVAVRNGAGRVRLRGVVAFTARCARVLVRSTNGKLHHCYYRDVESSNK